MIAITSFSGLRLLQLLFGIASVACMSLPWFKISSGIVVNGSVSHPVSGWSADFGLLLLIPVVGSLLISFLESAFSRRACFSHIVFFAATLMVGVLAHAKQFVCSSLHDAAWGIDFFLLIASILFTLSAMLSPEPMLPGNDNE